MRHPRTVFAAVAATITLSVGLAGCTGAQSTSNESKQGGTIRMAVTDLQGLEELQREFGAFETKFEQLSGYAVDFFPVSDRTAAAAALKANQVDLVFTGPAEYVALHARTQAQPVVSINRPGYHSVIYTSKNAGISDLQQLKGKKVGMTDVGSTSGHLGPSQLLKDAGIDPLKDLKVLTVGDTVHVALTRGDVSAAGVGYHDYEESVAQDKRGDFPILVEGRDLPPDVIMARPGLDQAVTTKVKDTFTGHWDELLPALLEGKDNAKYKGATVVSTTDADYNTVRSMYRTIGVEDFANAPE